MNTCGHHLAVVKFRNCCEKIQLEITLRDYHDTLAGETYTEGSRTVVDVPVGDSGRDWRRCIS